MNDKEKFIRFKNRLLGPSFLNDGTHFAQVLGWNDFQFWGHLEEKAPYLPLTAPLSDITKGQIILERIDIEPSPRRMADLLQAVYNAFAFYSITPKGDYDEHWKQFASWLKSHIESIGLLGMKMRWIEEPEVCYTPKPIVERYYSPGELEITYTGPNWAETESKKILENGFSSRVLKNARELQKIYLNNKPGGAKKWWERTWIQILLVLGAVAGIISIYSLFK